MKPFRTVTGAAAVLPVAHIDTDQILPARYMKTLSREGLGRRLFNDWRYDPDGSEREEFVLNRPEGREAQILVTYENFGCGSSREHAVWALSDFGIRALIAPSFGSIFATNCVKNGVLPVRLPADVCEALIRDIAGVHGVVMSVDLDQEKVTGPDGRQYAFSVRTDIRNVLLEGLDDISRTLRHKKALTLFEMAREGG
ncbi:MAG: 3-isopropylmalate dehydratase small subunit [Alphaproteobacteria bacterium HGW-Alphaproteobacteria-18]|nr:MAG: 3-isopropylmalate dehydratase small subunit [Alphaproteobacteria bacterium HGW-Alphaproteobacteria-18]